MEHSAISAEAKHCEQNVQEKPGAGNNIRLRNGRKWFNDEWKTRSRWKKEYFILRGPVDILAGFELRRFEICKKARQFCLPVLYLCWFPHHPNFTRTQGNFIWFLGLWCDRLQRRWAINYGWTAQALQIEFGYVHAGHIAGEFRKVVAERNPTSYANMAGNGGSCPTKLTGQNWIHGRWRIYQKLATWQ